jgi:protein-L-isoaspartate(D-aspartate) O-methyltransferase
MTPAVHFPEDEYRSARSRMVAEQIELRGVRDEQVLAAMRAIPRHLFCRESDRDSAYRDYPLSIDCGQTISQPYIVAFMTAALELGPRSRVLEVGTGSGYQTAVLASLADRVYSIEREVGLAEAAIERLRRLGIGNVDIRTGDGTAGWPDRAPYDAILVTAGAPEMPAPLFDQLASGGRLLAPVGGRSMQELKLWIREGGRCVTTSLIPVVFVPLIGRFGWPAPPG